MVTSLFDKESATKIVDVEIEDFLRILGGFVSSDPINMISRKEELSAFLEDNSSESKVNNADRLTKILGDLLEAEVVNVTLTPDRPFSRYSFSNDVINFFMRDETPLRCLNFDSRLVLSDLTIGTRNSLHIELPTNDNMEEVNIKLNIYPSSNTENGHSVLLAVNLDHKRDLRVRNFRVSCYNTQKTKSRFVFDFSGGIITTGELYLDNIDLAPRLGDGLLIPKGNLILTNDREIGNLEERVSFNYIKFSSIIKNTEYYRSAVGLNSRESFLSGKTRMLTPISKNLEGLKLNPVIKKLLKSQLYFSMGRNKITSATHFYIPGDDYCLEVKATKGSNVTIEDLIIQGPLEFLFKVKGEFQITRVFHQTGRYNGFLVNDGTIFGRNPGDILEEGEYIVSLHPMGEGRNHEPLPVINI